MGVQKPKNKVTLFVEERSVHQQQKRLPSDDTFVYIIHDNPFLRMVMALFSQMVLP